MTTAVEKMITNRCDNLYRQFQLEISWYPFRTQVEFKKDIFFCSGHHQILLKKLSPIE